ncbi:hypothetical protein C1645_837803 [Glomus cerebriforme]|uniref:Uncharacterized protein n=1 Tax=Glomus cerebriforme TaxID=658196 RepID=A0A397S636_9GLOM|nr:hypothetical protein C1645_837803 [Glomus cerebriforme]
MLILSRWLCDDAWKTIDFIYSEPFINASSQNFLTNNHEQILNPRHYNNVQEVQVHRQVQKKLNYGRIMGHFKQSLNYSLDDNDEKNLDDMILSYIAKKIEERESRCQTATEESQPSNNTVKLHDGCVYNINDVKNPTVHRGKGRPPTKRLKAFNEVHNKVESTSNSQQVNLNSGEKENEVSGRRCGLCHKTGHYAPKSDIEEILDLYAEIPTFHPDYKPIIDKMPPNLVKRAFDQLLNIKCNPVLPEEITEKSDQIEQYLRHKLIVYEQTENSSFSDKAVQTDALDKATQTEGINFLEQIKKANILLTDATSILSNI